MAGALHRKLRGTVRQKTKAIEKGVSRLHRRLPQLD